MNHRRGRGPTATRWTLLSGLLWALAAPLGCGEEAPGLETAERFASEGRNREALDVLIAIIEDDPNHAEANLLFGKLLLRSGQPSMAVWSLGRAAEEESVAIEAGLLLTQAQLESGSGMDAIAAASGVLEIDPENVEALVLRTQAHLEENQENEALADVERGLEIEPDHEGFLLLKFKAHLGLEDVASAEAALVTLRERVAEMELEDSTLIGRYCVTEAVFAREQGDAERADQLFTQCAEEHPTNPVVLDSAIQFFDGRGEFGRSTALLRLALEQDAMDLNTRVALANRIRLEGDGEEATQLLRDATEEQPGAWLALVDHFVSEGDLHGALEAMEQALAVTPNPHPSLFFSHADMLVVLGEYDRAEKAIAELEQPVYRHLAQGRMELARGRPEQALATLEQGIRLWPDNNTARTLAGHAAEQLGKFDLALEHYRQTVRTEEPPLDSVRGLVDLLEANNLYGGVRQVFELYLRNDRYNLEIHRAYFEFARRTQQEDLARHLMSRMVETRGLAGLGVTLGAEAVNEVRGPAAAIEVIESSGLTLEHPANAPALSALAEFLAATGDHAGARERVEGAVELHPEVAALQVILGDTLGRAGNSEAARDAYERALSLDEKNSRALVGLARLAEASGDLDEALALYDRASEADNGDASIAYAAALLALGRGAEMQADAERRLEALLRDHPRHPGAASQLALLLIARTGDPARIEDLASRGAMFSRDMHSIGLYSKVLLARGQASQAVAVLSKAVETRPGDGSRRYLLALALSQVGRQEEAAQALHQALASGPFPEEDAARARLSALQVEGG